MICFIVKPWWECTPFKWDWSMQSIHKCICTCTDHEPPSPFILLPRPQSEPTELSFGFVTLEKATISWTTTHHLKTWHKETPPAGCRPSSSSSHTPRRPNKPTRNEKKKKEKNNTPVRKSDDITPQSRKCVAVVKYTWLGWWMSIMARRWALTH